MTELPLAHGSPCLVGNMNCGLMDTGMRLARYEMILDVGRREGDYGAEAAR